MSEFDRKSERLIEIRTESENAAKRIAAFESRVEAEIAEFRREPPQIADGALVDAFAADLRAQSEFYANLQKSQENLIENCTELFEAFERDERRLRAEVAAIAERLQNVAEESSDERERAERAALSENIRRLKEENALKTVESESLAIQIRKLESELAASEATLAETLQKCEEMREAIAREENEREREREELRSLESELQSREAQLQLAERELLAAAELRRDCNNKLQNLKGNIRVYLRVKPLTGARSLLTATEREVTLVVPSRLIKSDNQPREHTFAFEHVFAHDCAQETVFEELRPLMMSVVDGYNVCIIAYGPTGAGKTFTIVGDGSEARRGLAARALESIFESLAAAPAFEPRWTASVALSEVYLDAVRCLGDGEQPTPVANVYDAFRILQGALDRRVTMSTAANAHSSRSHLVFSLNVRTEAAGDEARNANLVLVDLAGSERLETAKVHGERLKEMLSINRSLSALGDVMNALYRKEKFVPFRNSKLTSLLQEYLGGDAKVVMIVNLNSDESEYAQTLSSLKFAAKVGKVDGITKS